MLEEPHQWQGFSIGSARTLSFSPLKHMEKEVWQRDSDLQCRVPAGDTEWIEKYAAVLLWQERLIWACDRASVCVGQKRWCAVASHHHRQQTRGKQSSRGSLLSIFWDYVSKNFYTITGDSEASNWVLQFLYPRQCTSAVLFDSSRHTHTHTHNRSGSILISQAQFDRSLNLAAS